MLDYERLVEWMINGGKVWHGGVRVIVDYLVEGTCTGNLLMEEVFM